jgi:hypothetical protein
MPNPWHVLPLTSPLTALRALSRLSLDGAANAAGLARASSVHTQERREARGELSTVTVLLERAAAWGWEVEIRVRRRK